MIMDKPLRVRDLIACFVGLALALWVNGAIPLLMSPTLAQAIWSMGYAQSFANGPWATFHAHEFGLPQAAAPIAFGLAGAWPASLLLRLGLAPVDAYTTMVAFWLTVAFLSARKIALLHGTSRTIALFAAVLWCTMPIIWAHAGYSMLSLGIALLPFYFLATLRLLGVAGGRFAFNALIYGAVAIIAVFMDGYSFMMFALGASLLFVVAATRAVRPRRFVILGVMPVHALSFGLAYLLYVRYVGTSEFDKSPLEFFRGWGVDLAFMVAPSQGVLWLADLLGISVGRTTSQFYGDASVWQTTFVLPLLVACIVTLWGSRKRPWLIYAALLVALVAFYLALGPSLKVQSTKPPEALNDPVLRQQPLMPEDRAVMPTGSAWIFEKLPGFSAMRASYRWAALGVFAAWLVLVLAISTRSAQRRWQVLLAVLILLNLPHPVHQWLFASDNRTQFLNIDRHLVGLLKQRLQPGETVAFLPWGNDFLANYLAPRASIRTFNIGGDKGLSQAQASWPRALLASSDLSEDSLAAGVSLLVDGHADALVLPYFDMLWAAHFWPCAEETAARVLGQRIDPGASCPQQRRQFLAELIADYSRWPFLTVSDNELFAVVRPVPEYRGSSGASHLRAHLRDQLDYPIHFNGPSISRFLVLSKGWYSVETGHVWSQAKAELELPLPDRCVDTKCDIHLELGAFGASEQRPVQVSLAVHCPSGVHESRMEFLSGQRREVAIAGCKRGAVQRVSLAIPSAISPQALSGSADARVLGVSLSQVDIR